MQVDIRPLESMQPREDNIASGCLGIRVDLFAGDCSVLC